MAILNSTFNLPICQFWIGHILVSVSTISLKQLLPKLKSSTNINFKISGKLLMVSSSQKLWYLLRQWHKTELIYMPCLNGLSLIVDTLLKQTTDICFDLFVQDYWLKISINKEQSHLCLKGYLHYKSIFCHKVPLDV